MLIYNLFKKVADIKLIEEIKLSLGIRTNLVDEEIKSLILASMADLELIGIKKDKILYEHDPLIKRAITLYVKGNFGWNNPESEKVLKSYEMLKQHLSLCIYYTQEDV